MDHDSRKDFAFLTLAGQNVSVHTSDGAIWEGVFVATDAKASEAILLSCAVRCKEAGGGSEPAVWFEKCYIPMETVMLINAVDIKMQTGNTATEKVAPSRPAPLPENPNNMKWDEDVSLDTFEAEEKNWKQGKGWDQFAENERKFGVKSTYEEALYTTKMGKYTPAQMAEADRKAREIESSAAIGGIQQRIERGEEIDVDEGEMYSDVKRVEQKRQDKSRKKQALFEIAQTAAHHGLTSGAPSISAIGSSITASQSVEQSNNKGSEPPQPNVAAHYAPPVQSYHMMQQMAAPPASFYGSRRYVVSSALIAEVSLAAEVCLAPYLSIDAQNHSRFGEGKDSLDYSRAQQSPPPLTPLTVTHNVPPSLSNEIYMLTALSAPLAWPKDDPSTIDVAAERLSCYGSRPRYPSIGGGSQSNHSDSGRGGYARSVNVSSHNGYGHPGSQPPPSPAADNFINYNEPPQSQYPPNNPYAVPTNNIPYPNQQGFTGGAPPPALAPQGHHRNGQGHYDTKHASDNSYFQNPAPIQGGPSPHGGPNSFSQPNVHSNQPPPQQYYNGSKRPNRGWDESGAKNSNQPNNASYSEAPPPPASKQMAHNHRQQPQQPTQPQQMQITEDERSGYHHYAPQPYMNAEPQRQPAQQGWRPSAPNMPSQQNTTNSNPERSHSFTGHEGYDNNTYIQQQPYRQQPSYDQPNAAYEPNGGPPPRGTYAQEGYQHQQGYTNDTYNQYPPNFDHGNNYTSQGYPNPQHRKAQPPNPQHGGYAPPPPPFGTHDPNHYRNFEEEAVPPNLERPMGRGGMGGRGRANAGTTPPPLPPQ